MSPLGAGRFLFVGLPGPELDRESTRILERVRPGGVILFRRNVRDAESLEALTEELRARLPETFLAVDAEGGAVNRLVDILGPVPSGGELATERPALARRVGRWIGYGMRLFGIDMDLAPVVDLDRGERGNALADRYLGERPPKVISRARAFLDGLHAAGVGGCLKHFPGLGGARADTHEARATVRLSREAMEDDLEPFRALKGLAGAVMVAHAGYPAYDPDARPASLSPSVIQELLRRDLAFDGLVISDDLEMQALEGWGSPAQRAEAAFRAGCDVLLLCHQLEAAQEAVRRLAAPGLAARRASSAERLDAYRRRLLAFRGEGPPRRYRLETVRERLARVHEAAS